MNDFIDNLTVTDITANVFAMLISHPDILPWFVEDGFEGEYVTPDVPGSIYLAVTAPGTLGVAAAQPINSVAFHCHVAFHPQRRQAVVPAARALILHAERILGRDVTLFGLIPANNRRASMFANALGFQRCGLMHKATRKGGQLQDMVLYERVN